MKLSILVAVLLAFSLSACMDSPVSEGRADLPAKDFAEYAKEREALQNSSNNAAPDSEPQPYK